MFKFQPNVAYNNNNNTMLLTRLPHTSTVQLCSVTTSANSQTISSLLPLHGQRNQQKKSASQYQS